MIVLVLKMYTDAAFARFQSLPRKMTSSRQRPLSVLLSPSTSDRQKSPYLSVNSLSLNLLPWYRSAGVGSSARLPRCGTNAFCAWQ